MDFSAMKVAELKAELGQRGLKRSGLKAELIERLQGSGPPETNTAPEEESQRTPPPILPKESPGTPPPTPREEQVVVAEEEAQQQLPGPTSSLPLLRQSPDLTPIDRTMREYVLGPEVPSPASGAITVRLRENGLAKRQRQEA